MQPEDADSIEQAVAWRRHLHQRPELAYQETETARFIASRLGEWGYRVDTGLAGTGVVGTLSRGTSRKAIGLRADMDALPITEATGLAYASRTPGVMHACGHDGHVAMLLAAARRCARLAFDGTVHFIFQPAEENEGGARRMLSEGLLRSHPMDAVYALHNWPALEVGKLAAGQGPMMAAFGAFEIEIAGRGAHGAMPHEGTDCIVAAGALVTALQSIVRRAVSPLEPAVVSVTQIHGGGTYNVLPGSVTLKGTTRWFAPEVGERLVEGLNTLARTTAEGHGCSATVRHTARYPATINDPAHAALVRSAAVGVGLDAVQIPPSMAAEDFAFMLEAVPGCYFWLGARKGGANPGLHAPDFDFNDEIIPQGIDVWSELLTASLLQ